MLLITAGMRRSGSTLTYQIGCAIAEARGGTGLRKMTNASTGIKDRAHWHVAKTHAYGPDIIPWVKAGLAKVIVTIRDPRDIAVSIMHLRELPFEQVLDKVAWEIEQCNYWERHQDKVCIMRYEDFYNDLGMLASQVGATMDLVIEEVELDKLADQFSFANNMARSKEIAKIEEDYLFPGHIQDGIVGKWRVWLSSKQASEVEGLVKKDWFKSHGYGC